MRVTLDRRYALFRRKTIPLQGQVTDAGKIGITRRDKSAYPAGAALFTIASNAPVTFVLSPVLIVNR